MLPVVVSLETDKLSNMEKHVIESLQSFFLPLNSHSQTTSLKFSHPRRLLAKGQPKPTRTDQERQKAPKPNTM